MKVWPKNADLRRLLKHPTAGGFRFPEGPEDWPDDSFTYRLVRDGDLTTEEPAASQPVKASKEK
jgi:hypothetical protein